MMPIEPLCSWFRHLAYDDKDVKTMREYAYIVRRFVHFLQSRQGSPGCGRIGFPCIPGHANTVAGQAGGRCGVGQGRPTAQPALPMVGRARAPAAPSATDDSQGQSANAPRAAGHGYPAYDLGPVSVSCASGLHEKLDAALSLEVRAIGCAGMTRGGVCDVGGLPGVGLSAIHGPLFVNSEAVHAAGHRPRMKCSAQVIFGATLEST